MGTEWPTARIDDVAEKVGMGPFGSSIKVETFVNSGIPIISGQHLRGFRVEDNEHNFITNEHANRLANSNVFRGDVIFTHAGNIGQVSYIPKNSKYDRYVISQRQFYMRCDQSKIIPEFVTYFFNTPQGRHKLLANSSQTGVPSIARPVSYLKTIELPLPPLPEQRAITAVLEALDDKIELNRLMNGTLEAMARALFKSWFVEFDPVRAKMDGRPAGLPAEIEALFPGEMEDGRPRGWGVGPIGEIAKVVGGSTPSTKEPRYWDDGNYYWTTPKDLSSLSVPVLLGSERKITKEGLGQISSGLLPVGTILMSSRAPIGYIVVAEVPTAINQGFIAMIPNDGISNLFLLLWAEEAQEEIISRANGSTFLEISKKNFRPIEMVVPTQGIMNEFDRLVRPLYQRIVTNEKEARTLAALRDALLPKLMSGEVRVPLAEEADAL